VVISGSKHIDYAYTKPALRSQKSELVFVNSKSLYRPSKRSRSRQPVYSKALNVLKNRYTDIIRDPESAWGQADSQTAAVKVDGV